MTQQPLVSIIMPVYNAAQFIEGTIETVLNQTYKNWELVIFDDGSTDGTKQVVENFQIPTKQLQFHQATSNRGPGAGRNYAINKAKGELVAFLDGDDLWSPDKLTKQLAAMQDNKADLVLSSGQFLGGAEGAAFATAVGKYEGHEMLELLYQYNRIPLVSVITKKDLVIKAGGFKEEGLLARKCEDYDLWLRLAREGASFYGMKDKLVTYRIHADSAAGQTATILEGDLQATSQHDDYMKEHNPKLFLSRKREIYNRLAAAYAADGDRAKAKQALGNLSNYQSPLVVQGKLLLLSLAGEYYGKLYQRLMY